MRTFDLIGIPYRWGSAPASGATDCFQLFCEVRRRLGLRDYSADYDWAYATYTEETFHPLRLARWILKDCSRITKPIPGALCLPSRRALATATPQGYLLLAPGGNVVLVPLSTSLGPLFIAP